MLTGTEVSAVFSDRLSRHGKGDWKVTATDSHLSRYAWVRHSEKTLYFTLPILRHCTVEFIDRSVAIHEVAHTLLPHLRDPHSRLWADLVIRLGGLAEKFIEPDPAEFAHAPLVGHCELIEGHKTRSWNPSKLEPGLIAGEKYFCFDCDLAGVKSQYRWERNGK